MNYKPTKKRIESLGYDPRYNQELARYSIWSKSQEQTNAELYKKLGRLDQYRQELVERNLRFVIKFAEKYVGNGLDMGDLIQEGNAGLIRAAQDFDVTRGYKFISYAVWWIKQSMLLAISEHSRTIQVPVNLADKIVKLNKYQRLNPEANDEKIINDLGISRKALGLCKQYSKAPISIDEEIDENGSTLSDLISSEGNLPDEKILSESSNTVLTEFIKYLTTREQKILALYYGLGEEEMSLEQIGNLYNLSGEGIRQIKEKALKKLRATANRNNLKLEDFLN